MRIDPRDEKWGWQWFCVAGGFAVLLSVVLAYVDTSLISSDKEQRLGKTLYELRSAQTSLGSRKQDFRQAPAPSSSAQEEQGEPEAQH